MGQWISVNLSKIGSCADGAQKRMRRYTSFDAVEARTIILQKIDLHYLALTSRSTKMFFHSVFTVHGAPAILRPNDLFTAMMPVLEVSEKLPNELVFSTA